MERARYSILGFILAAPLVAFAAAPRTLSDLAALFLQLINAATTVLIVAGIVVYFWGISTNILKFNEGGGTEKIKTYLVWGLVVLFLMASIWGVLRLLQDTIFGGNAYSATNGAVQQSSYNQFQPPQLVQ